MKKENDIVASARGKTFSINKILSATIAMIVLAVSLVLFISVRQSPAVSYIVKSGSHIEKSINTHSLQHFSPLKENHFVL